MCCGYGLDGKGTKGYDCIVIPGASKVNAPGTPVANNICGQALATIAGGTVIATTICSKYLYLLSKYLRQLFVYQKL